jgi:hypothetical protein
MERTEAKGFDQENEQGHPSVESCIVCFHGKEARMLLSQSQGQSSGGYKAVRTTIEECRTYWVHGCHHTGGRKAHFSASKMIYGFIPRFGYIVAQCDAKGSLRPRTDQ